VVFLLFTKTLFTLSYFIMNCNSIIFKKFYFDRQFCFYAINFFHVKLELNCMFIYIYIYIKERVELKERRMKWRKRITQVTDWKFWSTIYLCIPFFLTIRWLVPWILQNTILISNFILLVFLVFFLLEEREEVVEF
jgi:hypothetical protein